MRRKDETGQAAVELVLSLPIVFFLFLLVAQVGLVMERQLLVVNAAREGARTGAVNDDVNIVRNTTQERLKLDKSRTSIEVTQKGEFIRVHIAFRDPTNVFLIGPLLPDITLQGAVEMRREF